MIRFGKAFSRSLALSFVFLTLAGTIATAHAELTWDAKARLLAGMNPRSDDPSFAEANPIANSEGWRATVRQGNATQSAYQNGDHLLNPRNREQARAFFAENLGPARDTRHLLYLFAGADVFYPNIIFPNLRRTVLVGLQPPAAPMDPALLQQRGLLAQKMLQVRTAFRALFSHSYFITRQMDAELNEFGTATMISVGLVVNGNRLKTFERVSVNREGVLVPQSEGPMPGFRITYTKADNTEAEVLYFQFDLSTDQAPRPNVRNNPEFLNFLRSMEFDTAYYKAASFVSRMDGLNRTNAFVLDTVRHVVESDDGIPLRAFEGKSQNWNVRLYGNYSLPWLGQSTFQQDLHALFDFGICQRNNRDELHVWRTLWGANTCYANNRVVASRFASVRWEGEIPFSYGYAASSGLGPRNYPGVGQASHPRFGNLMIFDKVR